MEKGPFLRVCNSGSNSKSIDAMEAEQCTISHWTSPVLPLGRRAGPLEDPVCLPWNFKVLCFNGTTFKIDAFAPQKSVHKMIHGGQLAACSGTADFDRAGRGNNGSTLEFQ